VPLIANKFCFLNIQDFHLSKILPSVLPVNSVNNITNSLLFNQEGKISILWTSVKKILFLVNVWCDCTAHHAAMIHLEASSVLVEWLGEQPNFLEIMFHLGKQVIVDIWTLLC
jgi:hypothetical protein